MTANKNEMIRSAEEMTKSIHQISSVLIFCLSNSSIKNDYIPCSIKFTTLNSNTKIAKDYKKTPAQKVCRAGVKTITNKNY